MAKPDGVSANGHGALLDAVRGLRWLARRRVTAGAPGAHPSRRRGTAVEFTEYRVYRQGDDPRQLDWKLLARTDRAYLRLSDDLAVLPTTIVIDASASMAYPIATLGKWHHARGLAVGLASVAHASGDPVGLAVASTNAMRLPPRSRRSVVGEIITALDGTTPGGTPAMAPLLDRGRGRVVIISDFLGDADGTLACARNVLAAGAEVYAVHVVAREELDPQARALLVNDPEDPQLRRPLVGATRAGYLARFAEWRAALRRDWLAAGAYYQMVGTDEPAARAIRRLIDGHCQ